MVAGSCTSDWDLPLSSLFPRKRRRICSQPLNLFSKLVDDLLVEILIRSFPNPKPACRSKLVCKRWSTLISDPTFDRRFISHHQSRNEAPPSLFLTADDPQSILNFLPVPDKARPDLRVMDCFKDLLLCGFVEGDAELDRSYLLCNPFTKQWIALPLAPERPRGWPRGHVGWEARLVCEPRTSRGIPYAYRFRVVCICQSNMSVRLDVFCSDAGKWTKKALVVDKHMRMFQYGVVSWNRELLWATYLGDNILQLTVFNPFRLDVPPASMSAPAALLTALLTGMGRISVSQGALHIIVLQVEGVGVLEVEGVLRGSRNALSVWRLEDDRKSWCKQYEMALNKTSSSSFTYHLKNCYVVDLHPEKPEIVFVEHLGDLGDSILSCNLRTGTGELAFFSAQKCFSPRWNASQPRVSCWPTPIPRYEDLRGMYDGSHDCLVQNTTLPSTNVEEEEEEEKECQSGHRRKRNRSAASHSKRRRVR